MATIWRCPRCGAVSVIDPQMGDDVVAVYDLCGWQDASGESGTPVRMERVTDPEEVRILTGSNEPALTR